MELYKVFVEQAPNAIAMMDNEMRYIMTSQQWLNDYQLTGKEVIGKSHYELFPEISEDWKQIHQECLQGSCNRCEEAVFVRANGTVQWINWDIRPWYQSDNSIGGILMFTADITKRKLLEGKLKIQEDQFRRAFETSAIGMALVGLEGQWIQVNDSLAKLLGYTREDLYRLNFQNITHPDDLHADLILLKELLDGKKESYQLEKRYFNSNGEIIWALLSVSVIRDEWRNPLHFVSQIVDITDAKKITHLQLLEMDKHSSRIAFELHENIAQTLSSIKLLLSSSYVSKQYSENTANGIDKKLFSLITDIKELSNRIMPTTFIHENLHDFISGLIAAYAVKYQVTTDLSIDSSVKTLSFTANHHLFRIIENQMKSAVFRNATKVSLKLSMTDSLTLQFFDNGTIETAPFRANMDLLINNIKTRVEMLEGAMNTPTEIVRTNNYQITIPLSHK